MTVVEIEPSGGYWTEILAPYLKATGGRYIGAVGGDPAAFKAKYADPAIWGDIAVVPFGGGAARGAGVGRHGDHRAQHTRLDVDAGQARPSPGRLPRRAEAGRHPGGGGAPRRSPADGRRGARRLRRAPPGWSARWTRAASAWRPERDQRQPQGHKDHPFGVWTLPPTCARTPRTSRFPRGTTPPSMSRSARATA